MLIATWMFVPAHDARKVAKALTSSADVVILDLEDAVPEDTKEVAREAAARTVRDHAAAAIPCIWVRVNALGSPHCELDLEAIDWSRAGLLVPKAEEADSLRRLAALPLSDLMLLIESAAGFAQLAQMVAAAPLQPRLAIGTWDLVRDFALPVDDPDTSELIWRLRGDLVIASRTLRLEPPVDGVYSRLDDTAGFQAAARRACDLGYGGKLLIHPLQIPLAAGIFGVTEARLAAARQLLDAYEQAERAGAGAISYNGQLVDRVHADRARALLQSRREATSST